jgi:hypothetical protein
MLHRLARHLATAVGKAFVMNETPVSHTTNTLDLSAFLPAGLKNLGDIQKAIPRIAKDERITALIEETLVRIPSTHALRLGDARLMVPLKPASVHLVLTSPPYWTLKEYNRGEG